MIIFEDRASEKGLRLVGKINEFTIELDPHHVYGGFMAHIYNNDGIGKAFLFQSFEEAVEFITYKFGMNNLTEFAKKANSLMTKSQKTKKEVKMKKN